MTTNYIQPGNILDTIPAAAVSSGDVIIVGAGIRVAVDDIAAGATGAAYAEGVFELAANPAQAWDDGVHLYWDATNSRLTDTAGSNVYAGCAAGLKANAATVARVHLAQGTGGTPATTTAAATTTA